MSILTFKKIIKYIFYSFSVTMKGCVDNGRFSVASGWGLLNKTPHYGSYFGSFRNYFTFPEKVFALSDYVKSRSLSDFPSIL